MRWSRRLLLERFVALPLAAAVQAGSGCRESAARCSDPDAMTASQQRMRDSLAYTDESPHGELKRCTGCRFFAPRANGPCGHCVILGGPVAPGGHCNSWSDA